MTLKFWTIFINIQLFGSIQSHWKYVPSKISYIILIILKIVWDFRLFRFYDTILNYMVRSFSDAKCEILFVWFFLSHSRICLSYGDVTIIGEGLQILNYALHSWPINSKGSLACHTYCGTVHPFIMVISEDPWHSHLLSSVW